MNAKKLIEENNRKRDLLTKENEAYYSDMLVYIRLQLTLSEQQTEEVLMEMLDHLLDGQAEGKSVQDIFGDDPKQYADEIIAQLPKEEGRKIIPFVSKIILNLLSWMLLVRGVVIGILSQFTEGDITVYPVVAVPIFLLILSFSGLGVWFIFRVIKNSLFAEKPNLKLDMVKVGLFVGGGLGITMLAMKFIPEIGPSFEFTWWLSLLIGGVLWLILFILKKRKAN